MVVILGKPNTGKSSFINYISGRDISIVTNIPGTTRDLLESFLDINGLPIRFVDTAGIRSAYKKSSRLNKVEKIGKEVIEMRVDNAQENELLEKLNRFEFTHERVGDTLYLFSRDGRELLQYLVSNDYPLVLHRPATLEDLFLKLTGRGLRE